MSARPLLITDCDEVLLHMVVPFREWLDEVHGVNFEFADRNFVTALRRKECGTVLEHSEVWAMLRGFFGTEMHRQTPIAGALETLGRIGDYADIVVLTNIGEDEHEGRIAQLRALGVTAPVFWNQGGKGEPARRIVDEYQPSAVLFVDDLAQHHESMAQHVPEAWRLHMVGEPEIAVHIPAAAHAHARIDSWVEAENWIRERLLSATAPVG